MFGSWLIRTPMARVFLIAAAVLAAGGCAYFNTYYNADNLFDEAERLRTEKGGSADKASAQYDACIKKCHDLLRYHSKSKYVDDALYMIGVCHFHRSEYIQAQASLRDLLDRFPNSDRAESAWYYLGLSALALGDRAGAASAFESLEKAYPSSSYRVDAAYRTAETFLDATDSESMRRALIEFIAKNPDSRHVGAAQLRIADTYYDELRFPEARAEYQKAIEADLTEEQRFEAELQIALTKRDEAELILTDPALYQESDLPAGLRLQIQEAATDSASKALSPAPALPESVLAQREQATKLLGEAASDLDDLRKQAMKFGAELNLGVERAVTVSLLGKPDEAIAELDQIARTDARGETGAKANYEIAETHRRYGRWNKAQESYDLAQRGASNSEIGQLGRKKSLAIKARTTAFEQLREAPEARRRWRVLHGLEPPRAGETDPRSGPDSVNVAVEIEQRFEAMAGHLLRIAEIDLLELEQPWLALRECQQLLADYPGSGLCPRAALGIGWIYDRYLSEPELALRAYEQVWLDYAESPQAEKAREFVAELQSPAPVASSDSTSAPQEVMEPSSQP